MICFNCKRQIPDNSQICPNCGVPIIPQVQVAKEIKVRRWQRWILYGVIAILFVAETAYAVKIYMDNTALLNAVTTTQNNFKQAQTSLAATQQNLNSAQTDLSQRQATIAQLQQTITANQQDMNQKADALNKTIADQTSMIQNYQQFNANLGAANANTYAAIIKLGVGMSNKDLIRIPLADYNLGTGADADKDGLSDMAEAALGTDPNKADTDGDTYNDKQELLAGFSAISTDTKARLPLDLNFAKANAGKILLQVEGHNEAWYVSPIDYKRYFLGRPAEALKALEALGTMATST